MPGALRCALVGAGARRVRAVSSVSCEAATITAASGAAGAFKLCRARQVWPVNFRVRAVQRMLWMDSSSRPRVFKIRSLSLRVMPAPQSLGKLKRELRAAGRGRQSHAAADVVVRPRRRAK